MTEYFTGFGEYPSDVEPSGEWTKLWHNTADWTVRDETTEVNYGDKYLELNGVTGARNVLCWDNVGSGEVDTNQLMKVLYINEATNSNYHLGLAARITGDDTSENGYVCNYDPYDNYIRINRYLNGVHSNLSSIYYKGDTNIWYNFRFLVSGEDLKVKIWSDGDIEPVLWNAEVTDSAVSGEGSVGFNTITYYEAIVDWYVCGTDGDAPDPPLPYSGELRVTQSAVEVLRGGDSYARVTQSAVEVIRRLEFTSIETNFSGEYYTSGEFPGTWESIWGDNHDAVVETSGEWGVEDGRISGEALIITSSADSNDFLKWRKVHEHSEVNMIARVKPLSGSDTAWLVGRGNSGEEGIVLGLDPTGNNITLYNYGPDIALGSKAETITVGNYYRMRLYISGEDVKGKVWADSPTEPSSWDFNVTNSGITLSGEGGIGENDGSFIVDYFNVSTDGSIPLFPDFGEGGSTYRPVVFIIT